MPYTPPVYPESIPTQTGTSPDLPDKIDDIDWFMAADVNNIKKELCAVMTELGTNPKGAYDDVKARLDAAMQNPMTTVGDLIVGAASGTPDRLALGAANLKLFVNAAGNGLEFSAGIKLFTFTRDTSTASGDVAYTGIGFKPSHAIFMAVKPGFSPFSIGFDSQAAHYAIGDGNGYTSLAWYNNAAQSIYLITTGSISYYGKVKSWDADGFTITWTKVGAAAGTATIYALLFR